ncbi:MAG: pyruvate kinase [Thermoplasmata archaeon]
MRRTKILATVGPASWDLVGLRRLIDAGADALRVNFSHGTDDEHRAVLARIHAVRDRVGRPVAIVADLQGPKIRLGPLVPSPLRLEDGDTWTLEAGERPGNSRGAYVSLPDLDDAARVGDPVLLGDGGVELVVERVARGQATLRAVHGGAVTSNAGVFLPRAHLRTTILGPRDLHDLDVALSAGVDFIALSFVRDARDIVSARREIDRRRPAEPPRIIAKIERAEALGRIDSILPVTDAVMVARGDLGIEVPLERLALEQKMLVRKANAAARPVIVATQMLLSMLRSPRPTRAEATDVGNAVLDGADALMLSEESAVGEYPVDSVRWLDRIAAAMERELTREPRGMGEGTSDIPLERAVAEGAVRLAHELKASAIVTPTHSGRTARLVASHRPSAPILALSSQPATVRQLALVWGVRSFPSPKHLSLDALRELAVRSAHEHLRDGPRRPIVMTAGYPVEGRATNLVTVLEPVPSGAPTPRRPRAPKGRPGSA